MALNFSFKFLCYVNLEFKQQLFPEFLSKKMQERNYDKFLVVSAIKKKCFTNGARNVFKILSKTQDRAFCKNSERFSASVDIWLCSERTFVKLSFLTSTAQKWGFLLRISSVNLKKSAGNCGFGHIYRRNP